jgi:hypothetical protein
MITLALLLAAATPAPPLTAVLELRNKLEGADRNLVDAAFLTDLVRQQALEAAPSIRLMTRENVLLILEASGRKLDECEGECEVDTGRRLGADVVVTGELLRFGTGFRANLRLHDTHSAQLLSAAVASGATAEALEKDLSRAVAKLVIPLAGAPRPPEPPVAEHAIGLYLTGGYGALGNENKTPRSLSGLLITVTNVSGNGASFGIGARYYPARWLMLDGAWVINALSSKVDTAASDGNTNTGDNALTASAIAASANYVLRALPSLRLFGGVGGQLFFARVDPDKAPLDSRDTVNFANAGGSGNRSGDLTFARPFVRIGMEWSPQERIGIGLFGILYPLPYESDVYLNDINSAQGTSDPVLKYTLPTITANGSLAFYF